MNCEPPLKVHLKSFHVRASSKLYCPKFCLAIKDNAEKENPLSLRKSKSSQWQRFSVFHAPLCKSKYMKWIALFFVVRRSTLKQLLA
jgi:hypothetical protein